MASAPTFTPFADLLGADEATVRKVLTSWGRAGTTPSSVTTARRPAAIFRYNREPLMVQTGLTGDELEAALSELEKRPSPLKPWIVRDDAIVWFGTV